MWFWGGSGMTIGGEEWLLLVLGGFGVAASSSRWLGCEPPLPLAAQGVLSAEMWFSCVKQTRQQRAT